MHDLHRTFTWLCVCLLAALPLHSLAASGEQEPPLGFDHAHATWTKVLADFGRADGFDYRSLKKERKSIDEYLTLLLSVEVEDFETWTREQRYAFWINAYNAYTVRLVVDHYPLKSIRDIGDEELGTWDRRFIPLQHLFPQAKGKPLSLNDVEHEILRKQFEDARVHAAVNCASRGCPPLAASAFTPKGLDEQLDGVTRAWLADEERTRFDAEKGVAEVSEILRWFEGDFVRDGKSVAGWLAKFAPEKHSAWLAKGPVTLRYLEYDWALNDAGEKPKRVQKRDQ